MRFNHDWSEIMSSMKVARRTILSTLGLTAGSSLFPSLNRRAHAATAPKRFLVFYTYHGTLPQFLIPTAGTETDFTVNSLMKPYEAFKKDIVLLDGLDFKSHRAVGSPGNAHQQGQNHALSAAKPVSASLAGGISIDQLIARGINAKTKFPSLELGVTDNGSFPSYHNIAYSGPGQQMPSEGNPTRVWNNVFKGFVPSGGGSVPVTPVVQGPNADAVKNKSIIDYVKAEVDAVAKQLGSSDKVRLDNHLAAVRDLENSLSLGGGGGGGGGDVGGGGGGPSAGCAALPQPTGNGFHNYVDSHIKIIQMAFACDLTRVASLNVDELSHSTSGYAGTYGTSDVHDLIHRTSPDNGDLRTNAGAVEMVRKYHLIYANIFQKLLTALTMPDVDGKRMLDNTIVLWAGEIAKGSHAYTDNKWILAGSGGGAIRTGRWLKCNGAPHQNLFVTLARSMGVQIDKFGEPSTSTGALGLS